MSSVRTARSCLLAGLAPLAAATLAAGCGSDDSSELASLVPADAPVYVEATVRPGGEDAESISALTEKVGGVSDPGAEIVSQLDAALESGGAGLTYAEDVEPWLGERGAFFISSLEGLETGADPDAAAIVESSDPDAAAAFIDKAAAESPVELQEASYEGVDYRLEESSNTSIGIVEDRVVIGTDDAFKAAVDASDGDSLGDSDEFSEQISSLGEDPLLSAYVDPGAAIDAAVAAGATTEDDVAAAKTVAGDLFEQPLSAAASATSEAVTVDVSAASSALTPTGSADLLENLPGEPWLGFAISDAGAKLGELVSAIEESGEALGDPTLAPGAISEQLQSATGLDLEEDILGVIGDLGLFVAGTTENEIRSGVEITVSDADAASAAIDSLSDAVEGQGLELGPAPEGADAGFTADAPDGEVEVSLTGEELRASVSGPDATEPSGTLGDSELYSAASDALGDDFEPQTFIGLPDFFVVAEQGDDDGSTDYDAARPYIENLAYAILGTRSDDDRTVSRTVVGVE
jgi:hypothetical protein